LYILFKVTITSLEVNVATISSSASGKVNVES
jgi:hypothetical protein